MLKIIHPKAESFVLSVASLFLCWWFRLYFTTEPVPGVDLPGHIAIVERLATQLLSLRVTFYDHAWFSGWPALQFYAPLVHIVASLVNLFLGLFTDEGARLSVHLVLVLGCAVFPWLVFGAATAISRQIVNRELTFEDRALLALMASALSFWFLNHDNQWYGVGAAAVMNVGLFSQLGGWLCLLLHARYLFLTLERRQDCTLALGVSYGLLLLSHTLTAAYCSLLVLLAFLWFSEKRRTLLKAHLLGLTLAGFWLVPMIVYSGDYTALDIYRPGSNQDFFQIFFRYPLLAYSKILKSWLAGYPSSFSLTYPLLIVLFLLMIGHRNCRRSQLLISFLVFNAFALMVFHSEFIASSFPVGFHYYRFIAYGFLYFLVLLCPVLLGLEGRSRRYVISLVSVVVFASTLSFPHYERNRIISEAGSKSFKDEEAVIDYFRKENTGRNSSSRAFFQYFDNDSRDTWLGAHYLESRLYRETGMETINGLFIQSSIAYRMPVVSANLLGISTYNTPLLFTDRAELSTEVKLEQLRRFGVEYMVVSRGAMASTTENHPELTRVSIGAYDIVKLGEPTRITEPVQKPVVGYLDTRGTLSFRYLEYYFWARERLVKNFELIELHPGDVVPDEVRVVLINSARGKAVSEPEQTGLRGYDGKPVSFKVIPFSYYTPYVLDHEQVRYQHNVELDEYNDVERFLDGPFSLVGRLQEHLSVKGSSVVSRTNSTEGLFREGDQSLILSGLRRGELTRINYSYFPYWGSSEGIVYRGLGERIFVLPEKESLVLTYRKYRAWSSWLGWLTTVAGLVFLLRANYTIPPAQNPDAQAH